MSDLSEIERLRGYIAQHVAQLAYTEMQLAEAAAFLDALADRIQDPQRPCMWRHGDDAADCRTEARKLRGET